MHTQADFNRACFDVHNHKDVYEQDIGTSWERLRDMLARHAVRAGFDPSVLFTLDMSSDRRN